MKRSKIFQWPLPGMLCLLALAVLAQSDQAVAQEFVQPLPPPEVDQLNGALQRLARNARDIEALLTAGEASLKLGDTDAAIGFFERAEDLAPQNPRAVLGLAQVSVQTRDPLRAIGLFNAAEQAGASMAAVALDRGLAYDLVGDNGAAQAEYRRGLDRGDDAELRRRLALSQAIAGDRDGFQKTLNPLVARGDSASYRTRAFGLAILGDEDEAVEIAAAVMPSAMSARMEPYLRYMKRLTPAQQAAAANLGVFPRAAQIGRDSPQIAQYREQNGLLRTADARLAPQGQPLAPRADSASQRRRPDRGRSVAAEPQQTTETAQLPEQVQREAARVERARSSDPLIRTQSRPVVVRRVEAEGPPAVPLAEAVAAPATTATLAAEGSTSGTASPNPNVGVVARALPTAPATTAQLASIGRDAAPGFDLAQVPASTANDGGSGPKVVPVDGASTLAAAIPADTTLASAVAEIEPANAPDDASEAASVAEAFAAFADLAPRPIPAASGGVDITSIEPQREIAKPAVQPTPKPPAKPPAKPAHPSRHWVQIATGRDIKALGFDWRRLSRKAPAVLGKQKPHVTPWGEANRLLAGPYANREEARKAMNSLKELGVDSFTFVSSEGQAVNPLD